MFIYAEVNVKYFLYLLNGLALTNDLSLICNQQLSLPNEI